MAEEESELYLAEHRLPRITEAELALLQAAISNACVRVTLRGEPVSYLGSAFLPRSARLLSMFRAASPELVMKVTDSSQAPLVGLEVAIRLPQED